MTMRAFSFTKLVVKDLEAAERFYCDAIGLKLVTRIPSAGDGEYAQSEVVLSVSGRNDGAMLLLIRYLNRPAPPAGAAWTGFIVSDVDAAVDAAERAGAIIAIPCHTVESQGVRAGIIKDPDGHLIELVTMLAKSA